MSLLAAVAAALRDSEPHRTLSWGDLVVQRNYAPLPSPRPGVDSIWNRGCDFLLLDDAGHTTHFGRCRPSADVRAVRAGTIRARVSADPELTGLVPPTRCAAVGPLLVELGCYVTGGRFELEVPRLTTAQLEAASRHILTNVRRVTRRAAALMPELLGGQTDVDLGTAGAAALAVLTRHGLGPERASALAAAIGAGGMVPARIQHGDMWPANVLHGSTGFVLLDFEVFGEVLVPLYDVMHFVRSCLGQRASAAGRRSALLELFADHDADADAMRAVVRDEAALDGLRRDQVAAAFVYHVTDLTAKVRGRDANDAYWAPHWAAVTELADALRRGVRVDALLLGP